MNGTEPHAADPLEAELAAVVAELPPDPLAPGEPLEPQARTPELAAGEWALFCGSAMPVVSLVLLPQWKLTQAEVTELGASLAGCLSQLFPDGLDGKYACWFRLVACCGGIAVTRYMQNGNKLPGFGPVKPAAPVKLATAAE